MNSDQARMATNAAHARSLAAEGIVARIGDGPMLGDVVEGEAKINSANDAACRAIAHAIGEIRATNSARPDVDWRVVEADLVSVEQAVARIKNLLRADTLERLEQLFAKGRA